MSSNNEYNFYEVLSKNYYILLEETQNARLFKLHLNYYIE